jgi:hypothetical protein
VFRIAGRTVIGTPVYMAAVETPGPFASRASTASGVHAEVTERPWCPDDDGVRRRTALLPQRPPLDARVPGVAARGVIQRSSPKIRHSLAETPASVPTEAGRTSQERARKRSHGLVLPALDAAHARIRLHYLSRAPLVPPPSDYRRAANKRETERNGQIMWRRRGVRRSRRPAGVEAGKKPGLGEARAQPWESHD